MTTNEKIARRKLSLLQLAQDLANVSRACKVMGYSRQQFYEIRRNFQSTERNTVPCRSTPLPMRISDSLRGQAGLLNAQR